MINEPESNGDSASEEQWAHIRDALAKIETLDQGNTAAKEAMAKRTEAHRYLRRLISAANGGGAIALLGLFGAIVGSSHDNKGPRELLVLLAVFIVGLVANGVGAYFYARASDRWVEFVGYKAIGLHAVQRGKLDSETKGDLDRALTAFHDAPKWGRRERASVVISLGAFAIGVSWAGLVLWNIGRWYLVQPQ